MRPSRPSFVTASGSSESVDAVAKYRDGCGASSTSGMAAVANIPVVETPAGCRCTTSFPGQWADRPTSTISSSYVGAIIGWSTSVDGISRDHPRTVCSADQIGRPIRLRDDRSTRDLQSWSDLPRCCRPRLRSTPIPNPISEHPASRASFTHVPARDRANRSRLLRRTS